MLFFLSLPAGLYFISLIFFLYGIKKVSQHQHAQYSSVDCSIILCVRNGEDSISNILTDFENQIYEANHEFIIVDDHSTDNTSQIILDYVNRDNRFKYIKSDTDKTNLRFKKKALNAGIDKARYNHLLFTDVDCRVKPNWISSITNNYDKAEYIIGYSETHPSNTLVSKFQSVDFRMLMLSAFSSTSLGLPLAYENQHFEILRLMY
jgi:glycosyltransferase involved in cell wall biosynthesis